MFADLPNKVSRRSLLLGAASLLRAKPAAIRAGCQTAPWPVDPRDFESFLGVLKSIRQLGFEGFETGFLNVRGEFAHGDAAHERIKKIGLRFSGVHLALKAYEPQTAIPSLGLLEEAADGCKTLGAECLIVSGDSTVHPLALRAKADALTAIAKYCKTAGVGCAYHNRDFDFQDGAAQINGLGSMTHPSLHFVLDAGDGVADFFAKNWRRVDAIHLALGQGESVWEPLKRAIQASGWRGWLILADENANGDKSAEVGPARESLRRIFGV